jgi:hypothetical protein
LISYGVIKDVDSKSEYPTIALFFFEETTIALFGQSETRNVIDANHIDC